MKMHKEPDQLTFYVSQAAGPTVSDFQSALATAQDASVLEQAQTPTGTENPDISSFFRDIISGSAELKQDSVFSSREGFNECFDDGLVRIEGSGDDFFVNGIDEIAPFSDVILDNTRKRPRSGLMMSSDGKSEIESVGVKRVRSSGSPGTDRKGKRLDITEIRKKHDSQMKVCMERPELDGAMLDRLMDKEVFRQRLRDKGIDLDAELSELQQAADVRSLGIGEAGRELCRGAISAYGKGHIASVKGASVPDLAKHMEELGIFFVFQRIILERRHSIFDQIHVRFLSYMSDKKRIEREGQKRQSKDDKTVRTPWALRDFVQENGRLPKRTKISDLGRNAARKLIRVRRGGDPGGQTDCLIGELGEEFSRMRFWTNDTLLRVIDHIGILQQFCKMWHYAIYTKDPVKCGVEYDPEFYGTNGTYLYDSIPGNYELCSDDV